MASRLQRHGEWMAADGVWQDLGDLRAPYLWNVLGYLRWFAPDLFPSIDPSDPETLYQCLRRTAVVDGITDELVRCGEVADAEDAWRSLRASGPVPWELACAESDDETAEGREQ